MNGATDVQADRTSAAGAGLAELIALLPCPAWLADGQGRTRGNAEARALSAGRGETDWEADWQLPDGSPLAAEDSPLRQCLSLRRRCEATLRLARGSGGTLRVVATPVAGQGDTVALLVSDRPGPATLADWLGDIGHALRSPLSPIRTAAQLLRNPRIDQPQRESLLEIVERQIRELMSRIDELSDLVRVKRGVVKPECRACDVAMLLDILHGRVASRFEEEERSLSLAPPPEGVNVLVDQSQAVQSLGMLLIHAMRHTAAGGTVRCQLEVHEDRVVLQVCDEDAKAGPDRAAALLAPPVERHGGGLGASLYLVRAFLELSGGTLLAAPRTDATGMQFGAVMLRDTGD